MGFIKKKWYVKDGKDYFKFSKWILKDYEEAYILCDHLYIIVGSRQCYKCKKQTDVIAFGVEKYCTLIDGKVYDEEQNYEWSDGDIHITSMITPINKELQDYLSQKYNYHLGYSYTVKESYTANHCSNCKALQGHFFLYEEVDSPFFIDSIESVKALKFMDFNLLRSRSRRNNKPPAMRVRDRSYTKKNHLSVIIELFKLL